MLHACGGYLTYLALFIGSFKSCVYNFLLVFDVELLIVLIFIISLGVSFTFKLDYCLHFEWNCFKFPSKLLHALPLYVIT